MDIFEHSARLLGRNYANSPKVSVLLFVFAAGWFALDAIGISDIRSPWTALTLIPVLSIYVAERLGKIRWFVGITLPSLLVMIGMVAFVWVLNAQPPVPAPVTYCVLGAWVAAFGFLMFRTWTFQPVA